MWHHEKTTFKMDKTNTFVPRTFCFSNIVLRIPVLPCLGSFWCVKIEKYELWLIEIEKRIFFPMMLNVGDLIQITHKEVTHTKFQRRHFIETQY